MRQETLRPRISFYRFFSDKDKLLPLSSSDSIIESNRLYVTSRLKDSYIELFKKEGAATEDEFTGICENFDTTAGISPDPRAVAVTILEYMVAHGIAKKVDLKDMGKMLFVYQLKQPNILLKGGRR